MSREVVVPCTSGSRLCMRVSMWRLHTEERQDKSSGVTPAVESCILRPGAPSALGRGTAGKWWPIWLLCLQSLQWEMFGSDSKSNNLLDETNYSFFGMLQSGQGQTQFWSWS